MLIYIDAFLTCSYIAHGGRLEPEALKFGIDVATFSLSVLYARTLQRCLASRSTGIRSSSSRKCSSAREDNTLYLHLRVPACAVAVGGPNVGVHQYVDKGDAKHIANTPPEHHQNIAKSLANPLDRPPHPQPALQVPVHHHSFQDIFSARKYIA